MIQRRKSKFVIESKHLNDLISVLKKKDYKVLGPTLGDAAIVYGEINSISDLPQGYTDEQDGGYYRLKKRNDNAYFGYVISPESWKKYLLPPTEKLWEAKIDSNGLQIKENKGEDQKQAFLGVKACELAAIKIQDKVFLEGEYVNPLYKKRREETLVIAVNCIEASKMCFCTSMNTGPKANSNFDLSLTEVICKEDHYFVIEVGSKLGEDILKELPLNDCTKEQERLAEERIENTKDSITKKLETDGIKELLVNNYEHPNWEAVASKCLSCANCTMVCPTCFCTTVEDITDITGEHAERWQKWDSCFTLDFSRLHGGSVRTSTSSRYRQWITHKLATWHDQFDSSGCVGCGRCVTWCPVAIDITEEVEKIKKEAV